MVKNTIFSFEELTGRRQDHVLIHPLVGKPMHQGVHQDFSRLHQAALEAGFDIRLTSAFRSFEQQQNIWNMKARGEKIMHDDLGNSVVIAGMKREEILQAIMRFSAIPGASRHHWGTDMDIYDINSLPSPDYRVLLTPEEVEAGGIFDNFHCWLDERIVDGESFGFYRPYAEDLGGVARERWHISYWPVSEMMQEQFDVAVLQQSLESAPDLLLRDLLLDNVDDLFENYIANICPPLWL
jgi:LAS superfamily LD-carboxypeptidase LdcB